MFSFFALFLSLPSSFFIWSLSFYLFNFSLIFLVGFFLPAYFFFHERFIEVSWMHCVSDLRENECKKHGLSIESIQYELLYIVPRKNSDVMMKRTLTVGLQFSKTPDKDLYNQEGAIEPLNFDTCSNSEASSNIL
jgi:hypothetical protein